MLWLSVRHIIIVCYNACVCRRVAWAQCNRLVSLSLWLVQVWVLVLICIIYIYMLLVYFGNWITHTSHYLTWSCLFCFYLRPSGTLTSRPRDMFWCDCAWLLLQRKWAEAYGFLLYLELCLFFRYAVLRVVSTSSIYYKDSYVVNVLIRAWLTFYYVWSYEFM